MAPKRKGKVRTKQKVKTDISDTEEDQRARSIIERLSKKYLHKSPNVSAFTRGTVEIPSPVSMDSSRNSEEVQEKRSNEQRTFNLHHVSKVKSKPKRLTKRTVKSKDSQPVRKALSISRQSNVSLKQGKDKPCAKAPRPTLGHSTPSRAFETPVASENSMFGFEELETPLEISPVVSESVEHSPTPSPTETTCKPKALLALTNHNRPVHKARRRPATKKGGFCESEVERWVSDLTKEFHEVDKFDLLVE